MRAKPKDKAKYNRYHRSYNAEHREEYNTYHRIYMREYNKGHNKCMLGSVSARRIAKCSDPHKLEALLEKEVKKINNPSAYITDYLGHELIPTYDEEDIDEESSDYVENDK